MILPEVATSATATTTTLKKHRNDFDRTMSKVYVWYNLDGAFLGRVMVEDNDDAILDSLKDAIKTKWGDRLPATAPKLKVVAVDSTSELQAYNPMPTDMMGQKPLIVVAPPQRPQTILLLNLAMEGMEDGWARISSERTSGESRKAQTGCVYFYGLTGKENCQMLGPGTKHVRNAHIWPHNNRGNLLLVDLEKTDIDNPKNVLRLHSDIEHKLDRFQLTFVQLVGNFRSKSWILALEAKYSKTLQTLLGILTE